MNFFSFYKQIALFFALNVIFSVYLLIAVDFLSGILLFVFSVCAIFVCNFAKRHTFINVSGFRVVKDNFEKIIALVPFKIKFMDANENVLISNKSAMSSDLGVILDKFDLSNSKILRVKMDDSIHHFALNQSPIYDKHKNIIAYLQIEFVIDDIINYLNKDNIKEVSDNEKALLAFNNLNDALVLYEINDKGFGAINAGDSSDLAEIDSQDSQRFRDSTNMTNPSDFGAYFITSPSFESMLDFVSLAGQNDYILDLFHPSERTRVETILNSLNNEKILFESLMMNENSTFPVEVCANVIAHNGINLINLNIRDTSLRKINEQKRDRARILKIVQNNTLQKIHAMYLVLDKINALSNATQSAIESIIAEHHELQNDLSKISQLQDNALNAVNEIIDFYSQTDIKTIVNIVALVETMRSVIFTKYILNNTTISIIQKDGANEIYCDKNALKIVLIALIRNSLENINYAKGSNFYGRIVVEIAELNENSILLSIEDNGGGMNEANLERCFDAFYTTHSGKVGLGLSACKIIVEDLLAGEIMAMNTEDGFKLEITLPKE